MQFIVSRMKKVFLLAALSLVLAGCNDDKDKTIPTTNVNLSGTWAAHSVQAGYAADGVFVLTQNSMNAAGDFVATATGEGTSGTFGGNIKQGTLNMTVPNDGTVACKGSFSNNYTKYVGHCTTPGSSDVDITLTKK